MKDEIKEILDNVKKCCDITKDQSFTVYQRQDILALLDYITNLQESEAYYYGQYKDYKSRCEKANNILKDTNVDMPETLLIETIDYARHILNGGYEE